MSQQIPVVHLDKPREGAACNHCGYCCIEEVCALGRELGDETVCRALERRQDGSFRCGLVHDPYRYLPEDRLAVWRRIDALEPGAVHGETALKASYRDMLGVGQGCDSSAEAPMG